MKRFIKRHLVWLVLRNVIPFKIGQKIYDFLGLRGI